MTDQSHPARSFSNIFLISPPAYAEDLTWSQSRSVLTIHVLHRGFTLGAGVGVVGTSAFRLFKPKPLSTDPKFPLPSSLTAGALRRAALWNSVRRAAATGGMVGFGLMIPGLYMRMRDQDEYGWQDRSYRLLHSAGQNASDWGSLVGAVCGFGLGEGLLVLSKQKRVPVGIVLMGLKGWKDVIGFTALGSLVGTFGVFGQRAAAGK